MSVFSKLKLYSRRPVAVIMAAMVATSSVPMTPIAQAATAYADEAQAKGGTLSSLAGELTYNKYADAAANTYTITGLKKLAFDAVKANGGLSSLQVPQYDPNDDANPVTVAVNEALKKEGITDLTWYQIEVSQASWDSLSSFESIDGVQLASDAIQGGKLSNEGDTLALTLEDFNAAKSSANFNLTAVSANFSYTVKCTPLEPESGTETEPEEPGQDEGNKEQTAGEQVAEPKKEQGASEETIGVSCVQSYSGLSLGLGNNLLVTNVWKAVADSFGTEATAVTAPELQYAGKKGESAAAKTATVLTGKTLSDVYYTLPDNIKWTVDQKGTEDDFTVTTPVLSNNVYTVSITPKRATSESKTFTLTASDPNGAELGKVVVTVPAIKPADISYALPGDKDGVYSYRLKEKQQAKILADANAAIKSQIEALGDTAPEVDYYTSVDFQMMADGAANATTALIFTVNNDPSVAEAYANYKVVDSTTANIAAIAEKKWADTGISVNADNGGSKSSLTQQEYADGLWLNGDGEKHNAPVTATWDGHSLSTDIPTVASELGNNLPMNQHEGVSENNQVYAVDSEGLVYVVRDLAYRLDTYAPVLKSSAVVSTSSARTQSVAEKLEANRMFAAKDLKIKINVADGGSNSDRSGLKSDSTAMHFTYGKNAFSDSGNEQDASLIPGADADKKSGNFLFDLSAGAKDKKVKTNNIRVSAEDNAGNKMTNKSVIEAEIPMKYIELVQNASAPVLAAGFDNNDVKRVQNGRDYYNANRTFTVSVTDPFFKYVQDYDADQVITTITDGGETFAVTPGMLVQSSGDTWTYSYTFGAKGDADCSIDAVNYQNLVGTSAANSMAGQTFTIDKTAPVMQVTFDNNDVRNGKYYNAARTATITVTEHNFDPSLFKVETTAAATNGGDVTAPSQSGWSSNGDTHTMSVTFPGQGQYTLSVDGEDLATNRIAEPYVSPEFVVDTIKPEIKIDDVANKTAYAGDVAPSASVHDTNLDPATTVEVSKISYPLSPEDGNPYTNKPLTTATDMTVSYGNPSRVKSNDGVYTITVQAVDLAGNTDSQAVTWSVNRFGSTYVISDDTGKMIDQFLKSAKTVDVKVTEINPSGLDESKTAVELTRDTKNTTLKSGDNYKTDADSTKGWHEYVYTVDKDNYDKDGAYRVLFHSQDTAGNSSENTMEGKNAKDEKSTAEVAFAVDDTKPIASFVDLENGGKYEETSHKAKVSFEDNLKLDRAEIAVNGKTVAKFNAKQLEANAVQDFTIDGSTDKQDVTVKVWDAAGNESDELKASGVLVTNDALVLWMNNTPLFAGSIAAVIIVAGGIFFALAKKRKKDEQEA